MQERLQKLIAQAGIASRRGAEELIKSGDVTVNGAVATRGQAVVGPYAPEPAGLPHCRRDCRPGPCDGRPVESST